MDAVPLLLSFLALSIVSMDLALSIVWTRRARYSWSWALIAFSASLLGAVVAFALDQSAYLAFTGTARIVLHYIWETLMVADSAFILVLLLFAINWIIARPMTRAEMVHHTQGGAKLASKNWGCNEMVQKLSEAYHRAAGKNSVLITDVGQLFYEWSDRQALYGSGGAHPSELGSRIAAETIAAVIQQHVESKS